ncbi:glycosyltransferase [Mycolicibacterium thermoresistibile]
MAHYLLAATPLSGHVAPLVQIGAALRSADHTVTVLTTAAYADAVQRAALRFTPLPPGAAIEPPAVAPGWARWLPAQVRRFLSGRAELASVYVEPLGLQAEALRAVLAREAIDAVLVDMTFTGALPLLLSDRPRPPVLVCSVGPLTLSSADTPPFGMAWQPRPDVDYRPMTAVAHRLIMAGSQRRFDQALRAAGAGPAPVFLSDWPSLADRLLQLCTPGFEYHRSDLPAGVYFTGPVLAAGDDGAALPPWWDEVLAAPAVVHVTQGTFDNTDLDQLLGPTLVALADRADVLVVATTGGRPGQRFSGRIPANARVTDWLPYGALMPHVDIMVTNGGYGGVQHALSHGVPLIVAGENSDKAEIAARLEYSGAGISLGTTTPSVRALRTAIDEVFTHDGYRAAARRLGDEIRAAAPLDTITAILEGFVTAQAS